MTPDQVDRIISSLNTLYAEGDGVIDSYVTHIRQRDSLGGIPLDCIRQTAIENRASGFSMDMRRALEIIRDDLQGTQSAPTAPVSAPQLFDPETTLVTGNTSPLEAARELKLRRGKTHE